MPTNTCLQTLSGLAKDCLPNIGGIRNIYLANFDDVTAVTVTDNKVSGITMASSGSGSATAKFKKYHVRPETSNFISTLQKNLQSGASFVQTIITLVFPRMETKKRVEVEALSLGDLAAIVEDNNGLFWYFGRQEPVRSSAGDGQTGTARTDANRYQVKLQDNDESWPLEASQSAVEGVVA